MKILGNNSLSSKLLIALKIIIILTIMIMSIITMITIKDFRDIFNNQIEKLSESVLITGVFIGGILFIVMLLNLIKFFNNLKNEICFDERNIILLKKISNLILCGSIIYGIMSILHIVFANDYINIIIYNVFLWILTIIMLCLSLGMKVFIEIYKRAIEFKKENDFTI